MVGVGYLGGLEKRENRRRKGNRVIIFERYREVTGKKKQEKK